MSQYLDIAEQVLRVAKQPLNARQILGTALQLNMVPPDLYGQTQHKTLQARISEDILHNRDNSRFYRTGRGVFFLREYLEDDKSTAPKEVFARRRRLDLRFKHILSLKGALARRKSEWASADWIFGDWGDNLFYQDYSKPVPNTTRVWACSVIVRESKYLTYRRGSYREDRDSFLNQRSIGFFGPIVREDKDLFGQADEGLMKAVIEISAIDLDMPLTSGWVEQSTFRLVGCLITRAKKDLYDALQVIRVNVPPWFEPPRHRLSINDLQWVTLDSINDLDAFDPWSKSLIQNLAKLDSQVDGSPNGESLTKAN